MRVKKWNMNSLVEVPSTGSEGSLELDSVERT